MDYGMKEQNPIDKVHFYCKADPSKAVKISKEQVGFYFPSEKQFSPPVMEVITVLGGCSCNICGEVVGSMALQSSVCVVLWQSGTLTAFAYEHYLNWNTLGVGISQLLWVKFMDCSGAFYCFPSVFQEILKIFSALFQRFQSFYPKYLWSRLSGFITKVRIHVLFQLQNSTLFSGACRMISPNHR